MNLQGTQDELRSQLRLLLTDPSLLDYQCTCTFRGLDAAGRGALTLPDVAPLLRTLLAAAGRTASAQAELEVWDRHCDGQMRHMTAPQFKALVRALFEDVIRAPGPVNKPPAAVHKPYPAVPLPVAGLPAAGGRSAVAPQPPPEVPRPPSPAAAPPEESPLAPRRNGPVTAAPAAIPAATRAQSREAAPQPGRIAPTTPGGSGRRPMTVTQDAARSPPPPSSARRAMSRERAPSNSGARAAGGSEQGPGKAHEGDGRRGDVLTSAFERLPPQAKEVITSARSPLALSLSADRLEGRTTVLTSLEAALQRSHELVAALKPGQLFEDPEFGPTAGDPRGARALSCGDLRPGDAPTLPPPDVVSWLRPREILQSAAFLGDLREVRLGAFGDGWLVGALGVLALSVSLLFGRDDGYQEWEQIGVFPRLFWDPALRERGLYCIRFHKYGQWLYVIIDDRLPCEQATRAPLCAQAFGREDGSFLSWASLIEKAYAKLHGSYASLWSGFVDEALRDLTSWPTDKLPSAKYAAWRPPSPGSAVPPTGKDPTELWTTLQTELQAGALLASSRVGDGLGEAGGQEDFVHVDPAVIGLPSGSTPDLFCTGLRRNTAYAVVALEEVGGGRFVRLCDSGAGGSTSRSWCGRWSNGDEAWDANPAVAAALSKPPSSLPPAFVSGGMLPPMVDVGAGCARGRAGSTFWMTFEDWLQIFSHVFVSRPLTDERGWASLQLPGRWTPESCGGTPIDVKSEPALGTPETWARNPQCRLVFPPLQQAPAGAPAAVDGSNRVEVCLSLQQPDARMAPGSAFPFKDRLRELFLCISQLDAADQRLSVFNKRRIVKGGVSLISKRREVLLRTWLPAPGVYAIVPSTWEVDLGGEVAAPFLLSLHVRCASGRFRLEAPASEGWDVPARAVPPQA